MTTNNFYCMSLRNDDLTHEQSFVRLVAMVSCLMTKLKEKGLLSEKDQIDVYVAAAKVIEMGQESGLYE